MRLLLDTNTAVSALLWRGPPHQLTVRADTRPPLAFFSSPALLTELEEVLGYPRLAKAVAASGLAPAQLMQRYLRLVTVVHPAPIAPTILADPDDDHVLACALAAKAELIVSGEGTCSTCASIKASPYCLPPRPCTAWTAQHSDPTKTCCVPKCAPAREQ